MRLVAQPKFDLTPLEALRASLRGWLVETLVWLVETLEPALRRRRAPHWLRAALGAARRELDADLRATARDLRMLVLTHACARMPDLFRSAPATTRRPTSVQRIAQHNSFLRKATATALKRIHAGSLKQRAERLADMLDNIEPLIAEVLAQLTRMFASPRLPRVLAEIVSAARLSAPPRAAINVDTS